MRPAPSFTACLALAALVLIACGCDREEPTPPAPTPSAPPKVAGPGQSETITVLTNAFQTAPPEIQARVREALGTLRSGQTSAALGQLKMIDADSELNAEQQTSIREVLRAHRQPDGR